MDFSWSTTKEVFFAIGSIAGVAAFFRPVFESKFQRDQHRAEEIKALLPEQSVIELEHQIYQRRFINTEEFEPYAALQSSVNHNAESVRFSGPLQKYYRAELIRILDAYKNLRDYVQVPWWRPTKETNDGVEEYFWEFDKSEFFDRGIEVRDYAKHLYEAGECAERIKIAYQRFQIVSEMHLLETPFARWILPRRFKSNALKI